MPFSARMIPPAVILFDIAVRVELHHAHRPVFGGIGIQRRIGAKMVAAKVQRGGTRSQNACHMGLDGRGA